MSAKSRRIQVLIGSALPMLLIGSLQTDTSLAAERPDFSGNWRINEELSESPRDMMKEKRGGGRGRGGSSGGMGGGGSRGGGGREDMQARFEERKERIKALEILHQDPEMTIAFADGSSRSIYTDGRERVDDLEVGIFESTAKWKGNSQVVCKSEPARGGEITEIYELSESGDRLFVTTKMKGDGQRPTLSFKRVYDRALPEIPAEPDAENEVG